MYQYDIRLFDSETDAGVQLGGKWDWLPPMGEGALERPETKMLFSLFF